MRKNFVIKSLLLLFFVYIELFAQTGANPSAYYTGVIGNMRIQMYLNFQDSQIEGHYFYESQGINITLKGQQGANSTVTEYDEDNRTTGMFKGSFHPGYNKIEGEWKNIAGTKTYKFELTKVAEFKSYKDSYKNLITASCYYPEYLPISNVLQKINVELVSASKEDVINFISEMKDAVDPNDPYGYYPWERQVNVDIMYTSTSIISCLVTFYEFTGGAHPNTYHGSLNYWIKGTNYSFMKFEEMFISTSGYLNFLSDYILADLKKQGASFVTYGDITKLTADDLTTFIIRPQYIEFIFSPYHVASYAEGTFSVKVPYTKLTSYINPAGPLKQFVK